MCSQPKTPKRVVSVSLGTPARDLQETFTLLGESVRLERIGVGGDLARARELIGELDSELDSRLDGKLDGEVAAIGLGGLDLYLYIGVKRYTFRDAARLAKSAKNTPVVCGAGLKGSLERRVVAALDARTRLKNKRVLMVSATDRFGMAQALVDAGAEVRYGDLAFLLGVPYFVRSALTFRTLAHTLAPAVKELPISWLYPTGAAQEREQRGPFARRMEAAYSWAEIIAGDWHLIRRFLPVRLDGKVILTNTTTRENAQLLRARGATLLVTTTPRLNGRSVATNLLEAALVAVSGGRLLTLGETDALALRAGLKGTFVELQKSSDES